MGNRAMEADRRRRNGLAPLAIAGLALFAGAVAMGLSLLPDWVPGAVGLAAVLGAAVLAVAGYMRILDAILGPASERVSRLRTEAVQRHELRVRIEALAVQKNPKNRLPPDQKYPHYALLMNGYIYSVGKAIEAGQTIGDFVLQTWGYDSRMGGGNYDRASMFCHELAGQLGKAWPVKVNQGGQTTVLALSPADETVQVPRRPVGRPRGARDSRPRKRRGEELAA